MTRFFCSIVLFVLLILVGTAEALPDMKKSFINLPADCRPHVFLPDCQ